MTKKQWFKCILIAVLAKAYIPQQTSEEFNLWANYLNKLSWSFHRTTGLPFEDIQAQAFYLFTKSIPHYKPWKYPLKQHIQTWVRNELIDFINKQHPHSKMNMEKHPIDILDLLCEGNQTDFHFTEIFVKHENPIIRKAFEFIIEGEKAGEHIVLNGWLDKKLNKLGYQYDEIRASFKQIRMILKEA